MFHIKSRRLRCTAAGVQLLSSIIVLLLRFSLVTPLHLTGRWESGKFFLFLGKFGFEQTTFREKQGHIYGNITFAAVEGDERGQSATSPTTGIEAYATFVVVDSEYFLYYFGNRTKPEDVACASMFNRIDTIAFDATCNARGSEDFLRRVPCSKGGLCEEEDEPSAVVAGYQFTYRVQDVYQARYWYISMVSCSRNRTDPSACSWSHSSHPSIDYDIWIVNGDPSQKHLNPFEHQFSFELHDVFELYLIFFLVYTLLLPVQFYALSIQRHAIPFLLTTCMCLEYLGVICNFIHVAKFASDGRGVDGLKVTGNLIDMASQCMFMLLLLLIVKGWTITRPTLSCFTKLILFTVWSAYTAANIALFIWNQVEVDLISNVDEWQTWPGWIILTFRLMIMLWFLLELRSTFKLERNIEKARFYLHFGAGFLVWFVYLPLVSIVCTQVSALWRYKTILSVMYSADFLSLCVLVHLLWPTRSYLYFNLRRLQTGVNMGGLGGLAGSKLLEYGEGLSDYSSDDQEEIFTRRIPDVRDRAIESSDNHKDTDTKISSNDTNVDLSNGHL